MDLEYTDSASGPRSKSWDLFEEQIYRAYKTEE